jgi:hypothetical protein
MAGHIASASSVHWGTPAHVLERVRLFFGEIDLDPCASATSQALVRATEAWQPPEHDGLADPWGARRVFVNPPFGRTWLFKDGRCLTGAELAREVEREHIIATEVKRAQTIGDWARKCMIAHRVGGAEVILLLPAAVDTAYWQQTVFRTSAAYCFPAGRLEYVGNSKGPAPMASAIAYWGVRPGDFGAAFRELGWVAAGVLGWGRDPRGVAPEPDILLPPPASPNLVGGLHGAAGAIPAEGAPRGVDPTASPGDAAEPMVPKRRM